MVDQIETDTTKDIFGFLQQFRDFRRAENLKVIPIEDGNYLIKVLVKNHRNIEEKLFKLDSKTLQFTEPTCFDRFIAKNHTDATDITSLRELYKQKVQEGVLSYLGIEKLPIAPNSTDKNICEFGALEIYINNQSPFGDISASISMVFNNSRYYLVWNEITEEGFDTVRIIKVTKIEDDKEATQEILIDQEFNQMQLINIKEALGLGALSENQERSIIQSDGEIVDVNGFELPSYTLLIEFEGECFEIGFTEVLENKQPLPQFMDLISKLDPKRRRVFHDLLNNILRREGEINIAKEEYLKILRQIIGGHLKNDLKIFSDDLVSLENSLFEKPDKSLNDLLINNLAEQLIHKSKGSISIDYGNLNEWQRGQKFPVLKISGELKLSDEVTLIFSLTPEEDGTLIRKVSIKVVKQRGPRNAVELLKAKKSKQIFYEDPKILEIEDPFEQYLLILKMLRDQELTIDEFLKLCLDRNSKLIKAKQSGVYVVEFNEVSKLPTQIWVIHNDKKVEYTYSSYSQKWTNGRSYTGLSKELVSKLPLKADSRFVSIDKELIVELLYLNRY